MKEIIVTIDKNAKVTVEVIGFSGSECKAATKPLLDVLGEIEVDVETQDMYRVEKAYHSQGA